MKNFRLFSIVVLLFGCTPTPQEAYIFSYFKNNGEDGLHLAYSNDAFTWKAINQDNAILKPQVGHEKLMRDPCIIKGGDGTFHMVWTCGWNEKGIGYANSQDLIHWSPQKFIPVMKHLPETRNCWAPEIIFDNDLYMIYWASTIPGKFAETDSTGDDLYNHRIYFTTTNDFETFSDTKILYDKGFNVIDATIQKSDDQYVMFLKNETKFPEAEKNIRIATSNTLSSGYSSPSPSISENWVEGPTVLHLDNSWIVYFDKYTQHQMGAIQSSDLSNWTDISDKISFPEGTRHGTALKVQENELQKVIDYYHE